MRTDCLIIHLDRAHARLPQVKATKDMLPLGTHVVAAVDGQQMSDRFSRAYRRRLRQPYYPFQLRSSEVATFHSHRACWKRIVDDGLDAALILEDDLALDPDVFLHALELTSANIAPGDYVRFPIKLREDAIREIASSGAIRLQSYDRIGLGMQAQLVTRGAATTLLAATQEFDRPVDDFLQMQWVHGARVLTVWPSGVSEISSELGGSLISRKSGFFEKLRREILRPIYRRKMRILARRNIDA